MRWLSMINESTTMIEQKALRSLARGRLKDARVLLDAKRYDGAVYLGGYVVELALKSQICKSLKWTEFPQTAAEFRGLASFKTHDLDLLLRFSGVERKIKTNLIAEWAAVANWDPDVRYKPIGTANKEAAELFIDSADTLLRSL